MTPTPLNREIDDRLRDGDLRPVSAILKDLHPADVAATLTRLSSEQTGVALLRVAA